MKIGFIWLFRSHWSLGQIILYLILKQSNLIGFQNNQLLIFMTGKCEEGNDDNEE